MAMGRVWLALLLSSTLVSASTGLPSEATCALLLSYAGPRIIALGDVHGDFDALVEVLVEAGLSDLGCSGWLGGDATLVQTGDVADRGPRASSSNECLRRLQREAPASGGVVARLAGNHELMLAEGNTRWAHPSETASDHRKAVDLWKAEVRAGAVAGALARPPFLFTHSGARPAYLATLPGRDAPAVARRVNDALASAVQGHKRVLPLSPSQL